MTNLPPLQDFSMIIVVALLVLASITIFRKPMRLILRLLINTIGGFITLFIINWLGAFVGFSIGLNLLNAVIVGIFGLPGVGLLLIFQWLLAV